MCAWGCSHLCVQKKQTIVIVNASYRKGGEKTLACCLSSSECLCKQNRHRVLDIFNVVKRSFRYSGQTVQWCVSWHDLPFKWVNTGISFSWICDKILILPNDVLKEDVNRFSTKEKHPKVCKPWRFLKTLTPNSNNGIGAKPCVCVHATNRKYRFCFVYCIPGERV